MSHGSVLLNLSCNVKARNFEEDFFSVAQVMGSLCHLEMPIEVILRMWLGIVGWFMTHLLLFRGRFLPTYLEKGVKLSSIFREDILLQQVGPPPMKAGLEKGLIHHHACL